MIEVEQLHKHFGEAVAVEDLSFTACDGAITGLLGSNGAGKTTRLRMIGGVLKPQRGRIRIDDASPDAQRNIGALLDHTGLYPRLTARENIAYFGHLRGIPTARLKDRIEELLSGDMPFCWPTIYKTKSHQRVLVWADKDNLRPKT